ncbi:hypothetical protein F4777DRAFT_581578 [Nemania sp. FL0916]|nr:hypothetical protein F4777DRAFT_581578 [Nemania sp. FL0916]
MATNSGRGNPIDAADAPKGGDTAPPPVSGDVKQAVHDAAEYQSSGGAGTGVHASGQEEGMRSGAGSAVEAGPGRDEGGEESGKVVGGGR